MLVHVALQILDANLLVERKRISKAEGLNCRKLTYISGVSEKIGAAPRARGHWVSDIEIFYEE